jgi:hypothetical protein
MQNFGMQKFRIDDGIQDIRLTEPSTLNFVFQ